MEPIIYTSSDASAPQLSATAGALNVVLKACLITGYGTKTAAGWSALVDDATAKKLVLQSKNPKSIKSALELINTNANYATVTAYKSWNAETNTGIESFGTGFFVNRYDNPTPKWTVIATDRFFYIYIQHQLTESYALSAFGDAISIDNATDYSVLMSAGSASTSAAAMTHKSVRTNQGVASFPIQPYLRNSEYEGFGDRATNNVSKKAVFTSYTLSLNSEPSFLLPGALMPFAQISGYRVDKETKLDVLDNQHPFTNSVVALWQWFAGHFWIHTDDWG